MRNKLAVSSFLTFVNSGRFEPSVLFSAVKCSTDYATAAGCTFSENNCILSYLKKNDLETPQKWILFCQPDFLLA
jgi:hypothetical protein